jgi:Transposase domain (DUF772)
MGAPSLPPGRYFRMHMIGYFEGIDSARGIAWRCADSFSLRDFLRLSNRDKVPDHSWLSRTRNRGRRAHPKRLPQGGRTQRPSSREERLLRLPGWDVGLVTRNWRANVTRNGRADRLTIEKLAHDCLDVRFLNRKGYLDGSWVTIGATLMWPRIARLRIARYLIILDIRDRSVPQQIRVSWTKMAGFIGIRKL